MGNEVLKLALINNMIMIRIYWSRDGYEMNPIPITGMVWVLATAKLGRDDQVQNLMD